MDRAFAHNLNMAKVHDYNWSEVDGMDMKSFHTVNMGRMDKQLNTM